MTKHEANEILFANQDRRFVELVKTWSASSLQLEQYSEMLRLGRSYGKRHGMTRDEAIDLFSVKANRPNPFQ